MFRSSFSIFSIADKCCLATLFFCLLFLGACSFGPAGIWGTSEEKERLEWADTAMGTVAFMNLYGRKEGDPKLQKDMGDELIRSAKDLEAGMLSYRLDGAEVANLNANAGNGGVTVSPELYDLLSQCGEISTGTDGAFDITVGALTKLWNMDAIVMGEAAARVPAEEEIQDALANSGADKLRMEKGKVFLEAGCSLDLGSVGKGYALDVMASALKGEEAQKQYMGGVIALGGSILTFGEKPDGTPFKVGIKNPDDSSKLIGYLTLSGEWYVATSGDYERYFEEDGVRFHHILDPATGYPANSGLRSVTVLAKNGVLSDALATAIFVLGEDEAKRLADGYDVMVLVVREDGSVHLSDEMQEYFHMAE